jgi:hypothetical protein
MQLAFSVKILRAGKPLFLVKTCSTRGFKTCFNIFAAKRSTYSHLTGRSSGLVMRSWTIESDDETPEAGDHGSPKSPSTDMLFE